MSDRYLGLTVKVNSDQVKAGFDRALAASKEFTNSLGADAKSAGAAVDDIAVQLEKVSDALRRADTAPGLAAQTKAATAAAIEFTILSEKIDAAKAAGLDLGPGVAASLDALRGRVVETKRALDVTAESAKSLLQTIKQEAPAAATALSPIEIEINNVTAALRRAETADGLRAQSKAGIEATVALERLKETIAAAAAAGVRLGPDVTKNLAALEAQVGKTNVRIAGLKDAVADAGARSKLLADNIGAVGGQASSLTGLFGGLEQSSTGVAQKLGQVGLGAVAGVAALAAGYEAGTKLRDVYRDLSGRELPNLTNALIKFVSGVDDATGAFDRSRVMGLSAIGIANQHKLAIMGLQDALSKTLPTVGAFEKSLEEQKQQSAQLSAELLKLSTQGGAAFQDFIKKNAVGLVEWADGLKGGAAALAAMPPAIQAAIARAREFKVAIDQSALSVQDMAKVVGPAIQSITQRYGEQVAAAQKAAQKEHEATDQTIKDANLRLAKLGEENLSEEEFYATKQRLVKEKLAALQREAEADREAASATVKAKAEETEALGALARQYGLTKGSLLEVLGAYREQKTADEDYLSRAPGLKKVLEDLGEAHAKQALGVDAEARAMHDASTATQEFVAAISVTPNVPVISKMDELARSTDAAAAALKAFNVLANKPPDQGGGLIKWVDDMIAKFGELERASLRAGGDTRIGGAGAGI